MPENVIFEDVELQISLEEGGTVVLRFEEKLTV